MRFARVRIDPRRRWPALLAALVALMLVALLVGAWVRHLAQPAAAPLPAIAWPSSSWPVDAASSDAPQRPPASARAPPQRRADPAARATLEAAPDPVAEPDSTAEARAEDSACPAVVTNDRGHAPRQRWLAAMQASGEERQRAAGWLIGLVDAAEDGSALRDRLATLAASSADARVLAYAWRACRGDASLSSACQALAPDAWARVEPDNAAAWLAMAVDPRIDGAGQLDAVRRAAAATRLDNHGTELHALAQAAQPGGIAGLDRAMMARDIVEARADWLGTEALRQHCSGPAADDASLGAACSTLAALFATKGQTLPDLAAALETGRRLGWSGERLDALRDEEQALAALDRQRFDAPRDLSCAALDRQEGFYADVGRVGEVPALREALRRVR